LHRSISFHLENHWMIVYLLRFPLYHLSFRQLKCYSLVDHSTLHHLLTTATVRFYSLDSFLAVTLGPTKPKASAQSILITHSSDNYFWYIISLGLQRSPGRRIWRFKFPMIRPSFLLMTRPSFFPWWPDPWYSNMMIPPASPVWLQGRLTSSRYPRYWYIHFLQTLS
jgi:hypothetical protein